MNKHRAARRIAVIGAGPAGSLLAIYLAKRGFHVDVYERRPDMRTASISAGRSINLALSTRGIHALSQAGLFEAIMKIALPMRGRMMHSIEGELTFQPYGKDESEVIYAVSRAELNKSLMTEAEKQRGITIHFNQKCTGMDLKSGEVQLSDQITHENKTITAETTIGADGSASALRLEMLRHSRLNFSQAYLAHGYKELTIPAGPHGEFQLDKNALHIWPRRAYMLIALPNLDGTFGCIFFFPFEGEYSFATLNTPEKVTRFFHEQFPDAAALMPELVDTFFANPTGTMVTIKCDPWHVEDKMVLLGDAAHAIVPFFGQGVNCALEDCTYFDACLTRHGADWERVFRAFQVLRKIDTDAIAELALENFIEMRDHVADAEFLLRKQVELELARRLPRLFIPKYAMVTFHRFPYSVAFNRGKIQDRILDELCRPLASTAEVNWEKAGARVQEELPALEHFEMS